MERTERDKLGELRFGQNDGWKRLRTLVKELSAAFALAVPRPETEAIAPHLAFFQRVVAMIRKRLADETGSGADHARQRDIDAAVRQVIGGAVDADEVIDLFAVAGLSDARLDILGDEFLGRVAALEQKNLALETLRKLLNDQIRITERTNIVRSRKFREALEDAMLRYTNRAITTAEMISRLIDLAKSLRDAQRQSDELGLSSAEIAFYDALAENSSAREAMQSDTLRLMARKLTEMVKNMPKLDWTERESVRANLRAMFAGCSQSTATLRIWPRTQRGSSCDRRSCQRKTRSMTRMAWPLRSCRPARQTPSCAP